MRSPLAMVLAAGLSGLVFGVGLVLGGMTRADKVIAFLDVPGDWDPSLAVVMFSALAVYGIGSRVVLRRPAPVLGSRFLLPTRTDVDGRLVAGAALFGVGWGLGGFCPGPGLVSLASLSLSPVVFVVTMVLGMAGYHALGRPRRPRAAAEPTRTVGPGA